MTNQGSPNWQEHLSSPQYVIVAFTEVNLWFFPIIADYGPPQIIWQSKYGFFWCGSAEYTGTKAESGSYSCLSALVLTNPQLLKNTKNMTRAKCVKPYVTRSWKNYVLQYSRRLQQFALSKAFSCEERYRCSLETFCSQSQTRMHILCSLRFLSYNRNAAPVRLTRPVFTFQWWVPTQHARCKISRWEKPCTLTNTWLSLLDGVF